MKVNTAIGGLLLDRDECFSHWTVLNVLRSLFVLIQNFRQKKIENLLLKNILIENVKTCSPIFQDFPS